MTQHVLVGDIGGTKTNLALYDVSGQRELELVREDSFPSREYEGLEGVLSAFLVGEARKIHAAAFGIAGPVVDDVILTTNLPWRVEASSIAKVIQCDRIRLMNDLESTAYGALFLPNKKIHVLHEGVSRRGNVAVIAAGTGLGQAFLFWTGKGHRPSATEGGHADFAPRNENEIGLLRFLLGEYGRVSYERVLSGPGLYNVFRYLTQERKRPIAPEVEKRLSEGDPSAVVGQAGVEGSCATCVEAVELFVEIYGAQAGNLALSVMAVGGAYVGGGIVTKLLPKFTDGRFVRAFHDKGRHSKLVAEIPIRVILDPKTSLFGAAEAAVDLLTD